MGGITFFSGGTALKRLARLMAVNDIFSTHIISTFDNGGSSAQLRKSFAMPAVGDLRNRILALASPDMPEELIAFLSSRLTGLSYYKTPAFQFRKLLENFTSESFSLWNKISADKARIIKFALKFFSQAAPSDFNPLNASIGNLVLTALYLEHNRNLTTAVNIFSRLVEAKGKIIPISDINLQLVACLENGQRILGQEQFKKLPSPISKIYLTVHDSESALNGENDYSSCIPSVTSEIKTAIRDASLIVYPPGSFYSSVLANLQIAGIGEEIAQSNAQKIFIPNSGFDPETDGKGVFAQAITLINILKTGSPSLKAADLLHVILIDYKNGLYNKEDERIKREITNMGIEIRDCPIVSSQNPAWHEPQCLLEILEAYI